MAKLVLNISQFKLVNTDSRIISFIKPNSQWVPVSNQDPLANIKLLRFISQCVLNVLLNYTVDTSAYVVRV
jgi:hypothetical protein